MSAAGTALAFVAALVVIIGGAAVLRGSLLRSRHHRTGLGVVLAVGDVAGRPGDRRVAVDLELQVEIPGFPPFVSRARHLVPADRVPDLQPGTRLRVRADPIDPDRATVVWGADPPA